MIGRSVLIVVVIRSMILYMLARKYFSQIDIKILFQSIQTDSKETSRTESYKYWDETSMGQTADPHVHNRINLFVKPSK